MKYIIIAVISYILGSFCASIPISCGSFGEDIRSQGSRNAGATNMARCFGLKAGLLTLGCDMLKTVAALLLGKFLLGNLGMAFAGAFCILGHCFPVFYEFRGGKGVSVGAALGLMQGMGVFFSIMGVFALIAVLGKKVSLASIIAAAALPIAAWIFGSSMPMLIMSCFSAALVLLMHRENIARLLSGNEADFKFKKR